MDPTAHSIATLIGTVALCDDLPQLQAVAKAVKDRLAALACRTLRPGVLVHYAHKRGTTYNAIVQNAPSGPTGRVNVLIVDPSFPGRGRSWRAPSANMTPMTDPASKVIAQAQADKLRKEQPFLFH
jgi:hypothetical protein